MKKSSKKYYLFILGCQMNKSDAERIAAVLDNAGCSQVKEENEADIIIAVACSVRQSAIERIYGKAHQWRQRRNSGRLKTVLTGCVLDSDKKKIKELFDAIIDIKDVGCLPQILKLKKPAADINDYFSLAPHYNSDFQAYVPIMTGCNNYCSYCVVPYVRGREVSRPAKEIIAECRQLIEDGYKEITLLGQNVNSYRSGSYDFPRLLQEVDGLKGDFWLRFATSHPKDLSDKLIGAMSRGKHLTPYLHLPIQSGNENILQDMNRHYTPEQYLKLVAKIRRGVPGLMVSTDVIVGYPTETAKRFADTAKLMRQVKFDMAYINKYSPRSGTAAASLEDKVSWPEKKRREKVLNGILSMTALENNKKIINKTVKVLVDGYKDGRCFGKTATFKSVAFAGDQNMIGRFVAVRINSCNSWGLAGEFI